jgi:tungstate transport system substrate-binding protein
MSPADDEPAETRAPGVGDRAAGEIQLGPVREGRDATLSRRDVLRMAGVVTGAGVGAGVLSACGGGLSNASSVAGGSRPRMRGTLRLSSVVTVRDGGLWSELLPAFARQTGIKVDLSAREDVFTPARAGGADIVYSHYGHKDLHGFVMGGYGLWPRTVLFNLVCLLGPPQDPAGVRGLGDLGEAFARIVRSGASFEVNNIPELVYLTDVVLGAAGVGKGSWYVNHGLSKQDAMVRASTRGAYTIWGVTPFLDIAATNHLKLEPLVTDDPILQRIMVTIVVDPRKVPGVNAHAANAFQSYLISPATQARIRAFHNKTLGRPIFFAAGRNNEAALLLGNGAGSGSGSGSGGGNGTGNGSGSGPGSGSGGETGRATVAANTDEHAPSGEACCASGIGRGLGQRCSDEGGDHPDRARADQGFDDPAAQREQGDHGGGENRELPGVVEGAGECDRGTEDRADRRRAGAVKEGTRFCVLAHQVVGHQTLRQPQQPRQLTNPTIAASKLAQQPPPPRVSNQPQKLWRAIRRSCDRRVHPSNTIHQDSSNPIKTAPCFLGPFLEVGGAPRTPISRSPHVDRRGTAWSSALLKTPRCAPRLVRASNAQAGRRPTTRTAAFVTQTSLAGLAQCRGSERQS